MCGCSLAKENTASTRTVSTLGYWSFPAHVPSAATISSHWRTSCLGGRKMGMAATVVTQIINNLMKTTTTSRMGTVSRVTFGLLLEDDHEDMMNLIQRIRICLKHR